MLMRDEIAAEYRRLRAVAGEQAIMAGHGRWWAPWTWARARRCAAESRMLYAVAGSLRRVLEGGNGGAKPRRRAERHLARTEGGGPYSDMGGGAAGLVGPLARQIGGVSTKGGV